MAAVGEGIVVGIVRAVVSTGMVVKNEGVPTILWRILHALY